ncbi:hypothetical protein GGS24DRAFT_502259 [Hypoxylon argillaceum]|nr:hypothetical protein GGS24DRAFT_502259 [Hypoxylon argillaceum]KAI1152113.1 hypothetical protein F4825DRAFT_450802 [Nemania diffusa]
MAQKAQTATLAGFKSKGIGLQASKLKANLLDWAGVWYLTRPTSLTSLYLSAGCSPFPAPVIMIVIAIFRSLQ